MPRFVLGARQTLWGSHAMSLLREADVPTSYQKIGATKTFHWSPKTAIAAIKLWRYATSPRCSIHQKEKQVVERKTATIIDLNAEAAKHTMFHGAKTGVARL
jgi:hypothetical protein